MLSAKKLYVLYFLLIGVTSLSYVAFAYYPLPTENLAVTEVKGTSISGPFAFLPAPENAMEINSTYFKDGMNISFVVSEKCTEKLSYYYETILIDRGWENTLTEYSDQDLIKEYTKNNLSLEIGFFSERDISTGESCLINLIGRSY